MLVNSDYRNPTANDFFSLGSLESLRAPTVDDFFPADRLAGLSEKAVSTAPARSTALVPAPVSGGGSILDSISRLADGAIKGFGSVQEVRLEFERTKLNNQLNTLTQQQAFDTAARAIKAGQTAGKVTINEQGQVVGRVLGLPVPIAAQQFVDDLATVPEFRNANIAILLGLGLVAYLVVR